MTLSVPVKPAFMSIVEHVDCACDLCHTVGVYLRWDPNLTFHVRVHPNLHNAAVLQVLAHRAEVALHGLILLGAIRCLHVVVQGCL